MELTSIFLNRILTEVAKKNASSLHLTVGSLPMIRVDNELEIIKNEEIVSAEFIEKVASSFLEEKEVEKLKNNREIVVVKELVSGFRFRVNIFYQKNLPSISFHYISNVAKGLSSLNLPQEISDLIKLNFGLLVIAGPYSSGKTTTTITLIEEINKNYKKNIITIEDPIEYLFVGKKSIISQRQVGRDVRSVVEAINYCMEEDADVVHVGEVKSEFNSAMPAILDLAAGNSLVILEVNADSSIRAIEKIMNAVEKKTSSEAAHFGLADVLLGVIVQKLIPKRGGGLILAKEVLLGSGAVKSLLREGKVYQLESVIQTSRREGMVSMAKVIEELATEGEIKQEDAGVKLN